MNEQQQLSIFDAQIQAAEEELHRLVQQKKILDREAALLSRRQRTRRLCTRGGMLESFLRHPEQLDDAQIMRLLRLAFDQPAVRQLLESLLPGDSFLEQVPALQQSALP